MDVEMLQTGAADYLVSRCGEIDQPLGEVVECRLNCQTVAPVLDLRVAIPEYNLDVMGRPFVVQVL